MLRDLRSAVLGQLHRDQPKRQRVSEYASRLYTSISVDPTTPGKSGIKTGEIQLAIVSPGGGTRVEWLRLGKILPRGQQLCLLRPDGSFGFLEPLLLIPWSERRQIGWMVRWTDGTPPTRLLNGLTAFSIGTSLQFGTWAQTSVQQSSAEQLFARFSTEVAKIAQSRSAGNWDARLQNLSTGAGLVSGVVQSGESPSNASNISNGSGLRRVWRGCSYGLVGPETEECHSQTVGGVQ